jgi:predicted transcriptional regulator
MQHLDARFAAHHDASMRTTITLDSDVVRLLQDAVHRERRPRKEVINDALRRGLARRAAPAEPYRVVPHHSAVRAGIDQSVLNRLADELEDAAIVERSGTTA